MSEQLLNTYNQDKIVNVFIENQYEQQKKIAIQMLNPTISFKNNAFTNNIEYTCTHPVLGEHVGKSMYLAIDNFYRFYLNGK